MDQWLHSIQRKHLQITITLSWNFGKTIMETWKWTWANASTLATCSTCSLHSLWLTAKIVNVWRSTGPTACAPSPLRFLRHIHLAFAQHPLLPRCMSHPTPPSPKNQMLTQEEKEPSVFPKCDNMLPPANCVCFSTPVQVAISQESGALVLCHCTSLE